jgi:hypothetical protein
MSYHYSTLRFVPDPARAEQVNLGIVVGDDETGDWDLRIVSGLRRAKAIDFEGRIGTALAFIASLEERMTSAEALSTDALKGLSDEMNNLVQMSPPAPVSAESAADALDLLFEELIVDPSRPGGSDTKWKAVKSTLASYRAHDVPDDAIARKAPVRAGAYETSFDFTIHNGSAVQLVQCWSFQIRGQADLAEQIRSWAWGARAIHESGGEAAIENDGALLQVPSAVEIATVYVPPVNGSVAYDEAMAAFKDADVVAVPLEDAEAIGQSAADLLGATV